MALFTQNKCYTIHMEPRVASEENEIIEIQRDVDSWYAKRWDIVRVNNLAFLTGARKRTVLPNLKQLDNDLEILIKSGPEVLFELIIIEQGGLTGEQAGSITRILNGGNVFFELMGRRSEAHIFNSDELTRIEKSIWFRKQVEDDSRKIETMRAGNLLAVPDLSATEDRAMIEYCLSRWGGAVSDKKKFDRDFDMLNYYRGRQELVRDILIKQGGFAEEKADREMNDRAYAGRLVIELMKKSRSFLAVS